MPRRLIFLSVIGTGVSSITCQLVLVREIITQFQGNELTISLVIFCWLLMTGAGSYAAGFIRPSSMPMYSVLTLFAAILPLLQLITIRHFREEVFIHGSSPGFYHIFLFILAAISVYCLLSGFMLPYALGVLKANGWSSTSGGIYITDNIGDITGGIIFSFVLVYWFTPFQAIAITSSIAIVGAMALLYLRGNRYLFAGMGLLAAGFYMTAFNAGLETGGLSGQYGEIVKYLESPFGRIVITREGSQRTFWESGLPLYSDGDIMESEERIHYPLSQLATVGNVLIISGGLGETIDEALKYNPTHIDYVELDPYLTRAAEEMGILKKRPFLDIINTDARDYLQHAGRGYDAIIINLPDPDTFQINRFFTSEFFAIAKGRLNRGGVLSFGMEYSENFISRIRGQKLSSMYNTALSQFRHVEIIPGGKAYFLCSDNPVSLDIPALLRERSISTTYIDGYYRGNVTEDRIGKIRSAIDRGEEVNRDLMPRMINIVYREWFSRYDTSPLIFIIILAAVSSLYLCFIKQEEYVLFSTGLTAMGIEMLIIFTFQVMYGYIYLKVGAIVTVFLLGLLPGAILGRSWKGKGASGLLASELAMLCLLFLFLAGGILFKGGMHQIYFFIYCFIFSFCCGFQFPVVTGIIGEASQPIAGCLAADFSGAAVGTILVGAFLIPSLGIQASTAFLILIKLSSSAILIFSRGRRG
jgi:spermidine synthase